MQKAPVRALQIQEMAETSQLWNFSSQKSPFIISQESAGLGPSVSVALDYASAVAWGLIGLEWSLPGGPISPHTASHPAVGWLRLVFTTGMGGPEGAQNLQGLSRSRCDTVAHSLLLPSVYCVKSQGQPRFMR